MPALENARHEQFCQLYVQYKNGKRAALEAGFSGGKSGNSASVRAAELMKRPYIKARVDELQQQLVKQATKKATLDRAWVLERLKENADEALATRDRAAANRALELLGKELGMFVDRKMVLTGPLEALDAPRLARLLALAEAVEEGRMILTGSPEPKQIQGVVIDAVPEPAPETAKADEDLSDL